MKYLFSIFIALTFLFVAPVYAEESHDHDHAKTGGPRGGKLLEHTKPQAEFFLEKDKTATISFYNKEMKPVPAESQVVVVIAEKDGSKTQIDFEKKGEVLSSKEPLPESSNLVVQFRQTADAKPSNFRFKLDEGICGECKRAEYACICEH